MGLRNDVHLCTRQGPRPPRMAAVKQTFAPDGLAAGDARSAKVPASQARSRGQTRDRRRRGRTNLVLRRSCWLPRLLTGTSADLGLGRGTPGSLHPSTGRHISQGKRAVRKTRGGWVTSVRRTRAESKRSSKAVCDARRRSNGNLTRVTCVGAAVRVDFTFDCWRGRPFCRRLGAVRGIVVWPEAPFRQAPFRRVGSAY